MPWPMRDQTAIVGIGETEYTRWGQIERSEFQLCCEAVTKAVDDSGLRMQDIDGFVTYSVDRNNPMTLAQTLGVKQLRYASLYPGGGNSTCGVVHHAAMAIYSGSADAVVCYRSLCQGQFGRFGQGAARTGARRYGGNNAFTMPFGVIAAVHRYALQARRHMHEFGTTSEQFGRISVNSYANAQRNPRAVMYGRPITLEDHQNSRMIADPYHLYDCCQENDGACAVVVVSAERAKSLKRKPVYIAGAAHGAGYRDGGDEHSRTATTWTSSGLVETARDCYERAGMGPNDIDVGQFYENFTGQVLMAIEDFGFCKKGEGGPFIEDGNIDYPSGSLPINTSGGNLAEAYIHGLEMVVEGVRQMRGESTSQVEGAETCLVVAGPAAPPSSALILRN